jgi:hypothetical protein
MLLCTQEGPITAHILVQKSPLRSFKTHDRLCTMSDCISGMVVILRLSCGVHGGATLMEHFAMFPLLDGRLDGDHKSHSIHFIDFAKS